MSLASKFGDMEVLLGVDHSQLEIRVLAQMSRDEKLVKLIQSGEDIHSGVGHELTGVAIEKIRHDRQIRTAMKQLHFGIIYGMTAESVYYQLKTDAAERGEKFTLTLPEVTVMYNNYFKKFKGAKRYIDNQHTLAQEQGYVETLFGFRMEINLGGDESRGTYWANQAVNRPIQGTAHTLLLIAMAVMGLKPKTYHLLQKSSLEVHDALYVFAKLRDIQETYKQFMRVMEKEVLIYVKREFPEIDWVVPLKADAKAGLRLGVMVEYEGQSPDEFVEQWCQANRKFEIAMKKEMMEALS